MQRIEASWTGILLARQLAIINWNRWLFLPEKEFIQAVKGYLRRDNRSQADHLFRLNPAGHSDAGAG